MGTRPPSHCQVEQEAGKRNFSSVPNPFAIPRALAFVDRLNSFSSLHHSVSLTGGEPLLRDNFLHDLLPLLKARGHKIFLETNGTLPDNLAGLLADFDIISMDVKLPSSGGGNPHWSDHKKFLGLAIEKEVFVKAVITPDTTIEDVEKAISLVEEVDEGVPFVLQPVSPTKYFPEPPSPRMMLDLQMLAKRRLKSVLVIPQIHKLMNQK